MSNVYIKRIEIDDFLYPGNAIVREIDSRLEIICSGPETGKSLMLHVMRYAACGRELGANNLLSKVKLFYSNGREHICAYNKETGEMEFGCNCNTLELGYVYTVTDEHKIYLSDRISAELFNRVNSLLAEYVSRAGIKNNVYIAYDGNYLKVCCDRFPSTGLQKLATMLMHCAIAADDPQYSTVLIDDINESLPDEWTEGLVNNLQSILRPDQQLICTTNSKFAAEMLYIPKA